MKITITSIMVGDQDKALDFYTRVLGFLKKRDIPMDEARWLTLVSRDEQDGVELLLEPLQFEPARTYQKALFEAGIPATAFSVENIEEECSRLTDLGVVFSMLPTQMGVSKLAVLDDTCGNHIQLVQVI